MPQQDLEQELKEVSASLTKVNDSLKRHGERTEKDLKAHKDMTEEVKSSVDKLLQEQGGLQNRMGEIEQLLADGITHSSKEVKPMTMGQRVIHAEDFESKMQAMASSTGKATFDVQAALTNPTQPDLVQPDRLSGVITPPEQRLTIRDLIMGGRTQSNSVEFVRETGFTNNADVVSENPSAGKPESDLQFEADAVKVATVAHYIMASNQVLADAGMLQSYIDGRLRYGLKLKEEAQLLKGSGVGLNIDGIYNQASAYANPGVVTSNDTAIDRLRIAMLQVTLAEYTADGLVLNPIDWTNIELTKDANGGYIFGNPHALQGPVLWSRPVVATQALAKDEFLTGAFSMGAQIFDREDAKVIISTEDRDNFIKNMVTILCEERLALAVYRPEAFVKGSLVIGSGGA